jgi:hypothetical protein
MNKVRNKMINKEAKSYLAKLLATENITVEHRKVETAYFDLGNRLLVVPIWKEMNNDILDMLLAHEIGHALYTPQAEWVAAVESKVAPHSYLNIVEDARIEKLIKRKYPGLSQSFIKGYRDLINNDFFKTKDKDVNEMLLIDRLNMHFKMSHVESDIEFDGAEELMFVERMANVESFDDVVVLAADLAEYCKSESETKSLDDHEFEYGEGDAADADDNGDADESGNNGDGEEHDNGEEGDESKNKSNKSNKPGEDSDEEGEGDSMNGDTDAGDQFNNSNDSYAPGDFVPESETDAAWADGQRDLVDEKCRDNAYYHVHEFTNLSEHVVDYKEVASVFKKSRMKDLNTESYFRDKHRTAWSNLMIDYKMFAKDQSKAVSYMVKEFELKKAATAHSRSMQANSGVVDPLKLHSYKFNDDIFKRLTVTPDGKNHGLMMFIDWSGSMHDKIAPTIKQLMNLTMFCRKVQIPFEVYAFSNNNAYGMYVDKVSGETLGRKRPNPNYKDGDITVDSSLLLLNFISSKMTAKEYEEGMLNLHFIATRYGYDRYPHRGRNYDYEAAKAEQWKDDLPSVPRGFQLSSTPLNDTIMAAMKMIPAFQKRYNIDKMNAVFLTDGASDGGERVISLNDNDKREGDSWMTRRVGGDWKFKAISYNANILLTDRLTKKTVPVGSSRRHLTDALLKVLKMRTGCKVLGFFVDEKTTIGRGTLNRYFPTEDFYGRGIKCFDRKKVTAEFRKNKVLVVTENTGYDELYLLAGGKMNVVDSLMETPSENAKKGEIKRLFAGSLKNSKTSRVVLNKFIKQVA